MTTLTKAETVDGMLAAVKDLDLTLELDVSEIGNIRIRDEFIRCLILDTDINYREAAERLLETILRGDNPSLPTTYTIMAILAWADGADLSIPHGFLHIALEIDPSYSLAKLLKQLLKVGIPYEQWQAGLASLTREECLMEG